MTATNETGEDILKFRPGLNNTVNNVFPSLSQRSLDSRRVQRFKENLLSFVVESSCPSPEAPEGRAAVRNQTPNGSAVTAGFRVPKEPLQRQ